MKYKTSIAIAFIIILGSLSPSSIHSQRARPEPIDTKPRVDPRKPGSMWYGATSKNDSKGTVTTTKEGFPFFFTRTIGDKQFSYPKITYPRDVTSILFPKSFVVANSLAQNNEQFKNIYGIEANENAVLHKFATMFFEDNFETVTTTDSLRSFETNIANRNHYYEKYLILIGHNDQGNFIFPNGESLSLKDIITKIRDKFEVSLLITCKGLNYTTDYSIISTGDNIDIKNDIIQITRIFYRGIEKKLDANSISTQLENYFKTQQHKKIKYYIEKIGGTIAVFIIICITDNECKNHLSSILGFLNPQHENNWH
ncbi:MAG: hypothetical protein AAGU21_05520 [Solidesulfovibrio sp.]|uniref:hypothetical protein n=1 Tax=Solidesulfovibrio sp. TaxID=2910990 RepID=UPI003159359E